MSQRKVTSRKKRAFLPRPARRSALAYAGAAADATWRLSAPTIEANALPQCLRQVSETAASATVICSGWITIRTYRLHEFCPVQVRDFSSLNKGQNSRSFYFLLILHQRRPDMLVECLKAQTDHTRTQHTCGPGL